MDLITKISILVICVLGAGYAFAKNFKSIKVTDLHKAMNQESEFNGVVLDVRTPKEVASGILKGAIIKNAHSKDIRSFVENLDKTKEYYVYCHSGVRSLAIIKLMKQFNVKGVNINGGISAWKKSGFPVVDKNTSPM